MVDFSTLRDLFNIICQAWLLRSVTEWIMKKYMKEQQLPKRGKRKKVIVVDTCIWMDPDGLLIIERALDFEKVQIFVPKIVFRELDNLKKSNHEDKQRSARYATTKMDTFKNDFGSDLKIQTPKEWYHTNRLNPWIETNDDEVLACCQLLQESGQKVQLYTDDRMMRLHAKELQIELFSEYCGSCDRYL